MKKFLSLFIAMATIATAAIVPISVSAENYNYGYSYNNYGYVDINQIQWSVLAGTYRKQVNVTYNSSNYWVKTDYISNEQLTYTALPSNRSAVKVTKYGALLITGDGNVVSSYCTDAGFTYNVHLIIQEGENLLMYPYGYVSGSYCYKAANVTADTLIKDENGVVIGVQPVMNQWDYNQNWQNNQPPMGQPPMGQPPMGQPPMGPPPMGPPPMEQPQIGQPQYQQPQAAQSVYPSYGVKKNTNIWYANTGSTTLQLSLNGSTLKEVNSGSVVTYMSKGLQSYSAIQTDGYIWTILTNGTVLMCHPYGTSKVINVQGTPSYFNYDSNGFGVTLTTTRGTFDLSNLANSTSAGSWNSTLDYTGEVMNYNDGRMSLLFNSKNSPDTLIVDGKYLVYNGENIATDCDSDTQVGFYNNRYIVYINSSNVAYKVPISNPSSKTRITSDAKYLSYDNDGFVGRIKTSNSNKYVDI